MKKAIISILMFYIGLGLLYLSRVCESPLHLVIAGGIGCIISGWMIYRIAKFNRSLSS